MRAIFPLPLCILFFGSADLRSARAAQEHEHPAPEKLGVVKFPTSCSASVQKDFERAVALLHSFAYSAAEKAFRDVSSADPKCAMAHWGIAMTASIINAQPGANSPSETATMLGAMSFTR